MLIIFESEADWTDFIPFLRDGRFPGFTLLSFPQTPVQSTKFPYSTWRGVLIRLTYGSSGILLLTILNDVNQSTCKSPRACSVMHHMNVTLVQLDKPTSCSHKSLLDIVRRLSTNLHYFHLPTTEGRHLYRACTAVPSGKETLNLNRHAIPLLVIHRHPRLEDEDGFPNDTERVIGSLYN